MSELFCLSAPASTKFLNLTRPGKYAISVEYTSPFSAAEVEPKPFLAKENGLLRSNIVWIEVVRSTADAHGMLIPHNSATYLAATSLTIGSGSAAAFLSASIDGPSPG